MKLVLISLIIILSLHGFAKSKPHKHHKSHVHSSATLNLAFDGLTGRIEFKGAADGVVGFEHDAKTEKDKATLADAISKFDTLLPQMIKFDQSLECLFAKDKIAVVAEPASGKKLRAEHSDFVAQVNVICKKSPLGTKVIFDFTEFKFLKDIDATILIGDLQTSVEIKNKPLTLELK